MRLNREEYVFSMLFWRKHKKYLPAKSQRQKNVDKHWQWHNIYVIIIAMKDFISFEEHKKKLLADPEVKKYYDELEPEYALIRSVIDKRLKKKMSHWF